MNKTMMDILACPIDKNHPLELYEITEKNNVILEWALFFAKCSMFYNIIEEIPIMLTDELRNKEQEMEFLTNNKKSLPEKIITKANPWHL
jgi:uncharacterized protein YbaR (Trm112 family)